MANTAGGGAGESRKYFTAWGLNTLWKVQVFPVDASLDVFCMALVTQPLKCAVQCLVQPRDVIELGRNIRQARTTIRTLVFLLSHFLLSRAQECVPFSEP